jgi:hypothetical protein
LFWSLFWSWPFAFEVASEVDCGAADFFFDRELFAASLFAVSCNALAPETKTKTSKMKTTKREVLKQDRDIDVTPFFLAIVANITWRTAKAPPSQLLIFR